MAFVLLALFLQVPNQVDIANAVSYLELARENMAAIQSADVTIISEEILDTSEDDAASDKVMLVKTIRQRIKFDSKSKRFAYFTEQRIEGVDLSQDETPVEVLASATRGIWHEHGSDDVFDFENGKMIRRRRDEYPKNVNLFMKQAGFPDPRCIALVGTTRSGFDFSKSRKGVGKFIVDVSQAKNTLQFKVENHEIGIDRAMSIMLFHFDTQDQVMLSREGKIVDTESLAESPMSKYSLRYKSKEGFHVPVFVERSKHSSIMVDKRQIRGIADSTQTINWVNINNSECVTEKFWSSLADFDSGMLDKLLPTPSPQNLPGSENEN